MRYLTSLLVVSSILAVTLAACQPVPTSSPTPGGSESTPFQTTTPVPQPTPSDTAPLQPVGSPTVAVATSAASATATAATPTQTPVPVQEMPVPDGSVALVQAARHGGEVTSAAVEGGVAYAGVGPSLVTFLLNEHAPPEILGEPFSLNWIARDMAVLNGSLYMLDGEGHLFLFGVSDPRSPYVIQAFEGAGNSRVFVAGDWGFTTSDTCTGGECSAELQLFSLEGLAETPPVFGPGDIGPSLPVQARLQIPGIVHDILVSGENVFIAHQSGLLSASLPELQVLDELKAQYINAAAFVLPHAYLSGNELRVADLSDPRALTWDRVDANGMQLHTGAPLAVVGDRLYGFDTFGEFGHCWSSMGSLSLGIPAAPAPDMAEEAGTEFRCALGAEAGEGTLLVIDWDGLHFLDLSNPDQPDRVYSYANTPGDLELVQEGWAFGGSDLAPTSLWSHDLRDLANIRSYGPFAPRWAINMAAAGDYIYVPVWEDGLAVVDISNPSQPRLASEMPTEETGGPGLDAALAGDYLYLALGEGGLGIVDVSDPARPSLVGGIEAAQPGDAWQRTSRVGAGEGSLLALDEVWEGDLPAGVLRVFRLEDPANPVLAGEIEIDQPFLRSALTHAGTTAYILGSACQASCTHQIIIAGLEDVHRPAILSRLHLPGEAYDLALSGGYLFVAAGRDGIYVWDVSEPASPVLAAHADTPGNAEKVVTIGDQVYVSDGEAGLVVFQKE